MDEIWLEVEVNDNVAFISEWTHYMRGWFVDAPQTYMAYMREFVAIKGKFLTIHVKGLGSDYNRCKSFAIWYITNRESVSTHRLDSIYGKLYIKSERRKRSGATKGFYRTLYDSSGD